LTRARTDCYTQPDFRPATYPQQRSHLMAEVEEEGKRKGGKGKLLAILAVIGAAVAFLMFWRRRGGSDDEEFED